MPLYDYKCSVCHHGKEVMLHIADLEGHAEKCPHCGFAMNRQISAPMVIPDISAYTCPITGKLVDGRRAHNENLARNECRILEAGEREAFTKARAADEAKFEAAIEDTADRFIAALPSDKRAQLANEVAGGADATLVRSTPF